jgi:hypothetical protein
VVLGTGTEVVGRGKTYEEGVEWERIGEVRKWTDVPLHYPPFKSMASQPVRLSRRLLGLLW